MAPVPASPKYREWLKKAIAESGLSKREIARRMASKHPLGATADTIDTARRTLNKIAAGDLTPTQPTRDSIGEALGRGDGPAVDDDLEEELDFEAAIQSMARDLAALRRAAAKKRVAA